MEKNNKYHRCGRRFKGLDKTSKLHKVMVAKDIKATELHKRIENGYGLSQISYSSLLKSVKGERELRSNELRIISEILSCEISELM